MILGAIGERVREARCQLRMTQREMAKRLAVSPGYFSDVENGKNKANADILAGFALHFPDINSEWLLTGRGKMLAGDPPAPTDRRYLDTEALRVALQLFYDELSGADGALAVRLIASQHYYINLMYRTYVSHLDALLGQGLPEAEARAAAEAECKHLDKRELA